MKDIILPVTCYQIKVWLYILFGATAIPSLIIGIIIEDKGLLMFYGVIGSIIFSSISVTLLVTLWCDDKLPRFPIRCKCDEDQIF